MQLLRCFHPLSDDFEPQAWGKRNNRFDDGRGVRIGCHIVDEASIDL